MHSTRKVFSSYRINHTTQEKKYDELRVLNVIKKKCADLSTLLNERKRSVRDIFYSVMSNNTHVKIDFFKVERCLQLIRSAALPKNPSTVDEIANLFAQEDIKKMLGTTKDGKKFYNGAFESSTVSFCIFSSESTIKLYCSRVKNGERAVMLDGTFDVVPIGSFDQLLIIYAVYMEKVID